MANTDYLLPKQASYSHWMHNSTGCSHVAIWMRMATAEMEESDGFEVRENRWDSVTDWVWKMRREGGIKNDCQPSSMRSCMDRRVL